MHIDCVVFCFFFLYLCALRVRPYCTKVAERKKKEIKQRKITILLFESPFMFIVHVSLVFIDFPCQYTYIIIFFSLIRFQQSDHHYRHIKQQQNQLISNVSPRKMFAHWNNSIFLNAYKWVISHVQFSYCWYANSFRLWHGKRIS